MSNESVGPEGRAKWRKISTATSSSRRRSMQPTRAYATKEDSLFRLSQTRVSLDQRLDKVVESRIGLGGRGAAGASGALAMLFEPLFDTTPAEGVETGQDSW